MKAVTYFSKIRTPLSQINLKNQLSQVNFQLSLDNIFDKNSSNEEIFNSRNDFLKLVFHNGCLTILTFGQNNFLLSSDENSGILIKIAKQIFDFTEKNKEIKIDLKVKILLILAFMY